MTKLLQLCLDALIESRGDVDLCYAGVKAARLSFRQERQLGFYEAQLVMHDAAIEALKQALAQQEQPAKTERQIRRMFCATYASDSSPYMDDGEAQDNSMSPCIDFLRDSPEQIQSKMMERAIAKHKAQQEQYPLPDSLYPGSKDWMAGSYKERVEWLHSMYESAKQEIDRLEAQQEQPASVDAYNGAREDVAIWKKRALEAEGLNRKFIAEVNGPTYLGEPVKQEQPAQQGPVTDKKLAQRIADGSARWRTELYASAPTQPAQEPVAAHPIGFDYLDSGQLVATYALPVEGKNHPKLYTAPPTQPALTLDKLIDMAVDANLGRRMHPIVGDTGDVFYTDASYRTDELEVFARAIEAHCRGGAKHG